VSAWSSAQTWEALWWGAAPGERWAAEIEKQRAYAELMGMPADLDFGDRRIVDFGCGPVSLLLRSTHGPSIGVDPLPIVAMRADVFQQAGAAVLSMKAEDAHLFGFDEAWSYNVLQHVDDPAAVLRNIAASARSVRLFDWLDVGTGPGHPHNLTEQLFADAFAGWTRVRWVTGRLDGELLHGRYIAAHLTI